MPAKPKVKKTNPALLEAQRAAEEGEKGAMSQVLHTGAGSRTPGLWDQVPALRQRS